MNGCPVFFLRPFTPSEERTIRGALSDIGSIDEGENWGHDFYYFGDIFRDGKRHSLEDLRDLFESCDPMSPSYNPKKPGPITLASYPSDIVAVDEACLRADDPKVWMMTSLDFHGEDVSDQLGWMYGTVEPKEAAIAWMNLRYEKQVTDRYSRLAAVSISISPRLSSILCCSSADLLQRCKLWSG